MSFSTELKTVMKLDDKEWKKSLESIKQAEKETTKDIEKNTKKIFDLKDKLANKEKQLHLAKIFQNKEKEKQHREASKLIKSEIALTNKLNNAQKAGLEFIKIRNQNLDTTKKATVATKKHAAATTNLANQTIRYLRWAGTIVGVMYAVNRAWSATLGIGIQVNKMMEDNVSGIAALLSANTQMVLTNGEVVNSYEKFKLGQISATKTMDDLRKASIKTYATFPQLTEIFQQAIGQTLSMGDAFGTTVDEINKNTIKLTQRMSNIAGAIGMPMDRAKEEIRSLLSGNASTDSLISTMIFGSPGEANKAIRMAKDRGARGLTEMLDSVLAPFDALENVDSYTRSLLELEDAWSQLWSTVSEPLFEKLKGSYKELAEQINNLKDSLLESREESEKIDKKRRGFEIVSELKEAIKQQQAYASSLDTISKDVDYFGKSLATAWGISDTVEDVNKDIKTQQELINALAKEYNSLHQVTSKTDSGLITKPSFDTKFEESAQKKLNKEKSTTVKLEAEIAKANKEIKLHSDAISKNNEVRTGDEKTLEILSAQTESSEKAISIYKKLIKANTQEIADIETKAQLKREKAYLTRLGLEQDLIVAQKEAEGVEVTKEEIIQARISALAVEYSATKDTNDQLKIQIQLLKESAKLTREAEDAVKKQSKEWAKIEEDLLGFDEDPDYSKDFANRLGKNLESEIKNAFSNIRDFSDFAEAFGSAIGSALANTTTKFISDELDGGVLGSIGGGIATAGISMATNWFAEGLFGSGGETRLEKQNREREQKQEEAWDKFIDGLDEASQALKDFGNIGSATGGEIQTVVDEINRITKEVTEQVAEYGSVVGLQGAIWLKTGLLQEELTERVNSSLADTLDISKLTMTQIDNLISNSNFTDDKTLEDMKAYDTELNNIALKMKLGVDTTDDATRAIEILTDVNFQYYKDVEEATEIRKQATEALKEERLELNERMLNLSGTSFEVLNYNRNKELESIDATNRELLKSIFLEEDRQAALADSLTAQEASLSDYLSSVTSDISSLEGVFGSLSSIIDDLKGITLGADYTLQQYYDSMAESLALSKTTDYESFSDSLKDTISRASVLKDDSFFKTSMEQEFAQKLAINQFENLEDTTLTQIDLLEMIEENTKATMDALLSLPSASTTSEPANIVSGAYSQILGREAEAEGLDYWSEQLSTGSVLTSEIGQSVVGGAVASGEMTRREAIAELYRGGFGREPDAAGLDYWDNTGHSISSIIDSFGNAEEEYTPFLAGTTSVPQDMNASIHRGEIIIPPTFSEGLRSGDLVMGNNDRVVATLENIDKRLATLEMINTNIAVSSNRTSVVMEDASIGRRTLKVEVAS